MRFVIPGVGKRTVFLLASGGIGLVTACSAVLGFESLTPYPTDSGAPDSATTSADGGGGMDAGPPDGAPATCDADLNKDQNHCGRCNHGCGGGACTDGKCEPMKIADALATPQGLTVTSAYVFVAEREENRILKFEKSKPSPCMAVPPTKCIFTADQTNVFQPTGMGSDANRIYWVNTGGGIGHEIRSCPVDACLPAKATLIAQVGLDAFGHLNSDGVLPLDLVVRDGTVFWPESLGGAIRSAPADGGAVTTTYLETSSLAPTAIAVDDTQIYFTDDEHAAAIRAIPRDGTAKTGANIRIVAWTPEPPHGLGLTTTGNLFWTIASFESTQGLVQTIAKIAVDAGAGTQFATGQFEPHMLVVDEKNVYWVNIGEGTIANGEIATCPLSGCPDGKPRLLATGQRRPRHLAQDESAIYWTNGGVSATDYDGQVWKVAKP